VRGERLNSPNAFSARPCRVPHAGCAFVNDGIPLDQQLAASQRHACATADESRQRVTLAVPRKALEVRPRVTQNIKNPGRLAETSCVESEIARFWMGRVPGRLEESVNARRQAGMSMIELAVVLAIVGVLSIAALPAFDGVFTNQRLKAAARSVADALHLARSEAIRTGNTHLVVFQQSLGATDPIVIVDDGLPSTANCTIDAGEIRHSFAAVDDVVWGTTSTLANGTSAPYDPGLAPAEVATGSSFSDASGNASNPATWVLFQPDGIPRLFTPNAGSCSAIGLPGLGGGAIYLTNTLRDYAVVLSNVGTTRTHGWIPNKRQWKQ